MERNKEYDRFFKNIYWLHNLKNTSTYKMINGKVHILAGHSSACLKISSNKITEPDSPYSVFVMGVRDKIEDMKSEMMRRANLEDMASDDTMLLLRAIIVAERMLPVNSTEMRLLAVTTDINGFAYIPVSACEHPTAEEGHNKHFVDFYDHVVELLLDMDAKRKTIMESSLKDLVNDIAKSNIEKAHS